MVQRRRELGEQREVMQAVVVAEEARAAIDAALHESCTRCVLTPASASLARRGMAPGILRHPRPRAMVQVAQAVASDGPGE